MHATLHEARIFQDLPAAGRIRARSYITGHASLKSRARAGLSHIPRAARSLTWLLAGRLALVTRVEANPITSTASANQGAMIVGLVTL
jgi:hypothetical protein